MFKASAPGSMMLLGEYAVLHGSPALIYSINQRVTAILIPRSDPQIHFSSALGSLSFELDQLENVTQFPFVFSVLKRVKSQLCTGCDIAIHSEFSHQVGLGSSAAVTVSTLAVLYKWLSIPFSTEKIIQEATSIIREVQGTGSGADVAASVLGGIVFYRVDPFKAESLPFIFPMTVIYSGSKTPTPEAIKKVYNDFKDRQAELNNILDEIKQCVLLGEKAIRENNEIELGKIMNNQQIQMQRLGINTFQLQNSIEMLTSYSSIKGAKISGAGLGDCVIGLGYARDLEMSKPSQQLFVSMSQIGLTYE